MPKAKTLPTKQRVHQLRMEFLYSTSARRKMWFIEVLLENDYFSFWVNTLADKRLAALVLGSLDIIPRDLGVAHGE